MCSERNASRLWIITLAVGAAACGGDGKAAFNGPEGDLESKELAAEEWRSQTLATAIESDHPYGNNATIEKRVTAPTGATAIRLIVRVRTEKDYDFVEFMDERRNVVLRFSGPGEGMTPVIDGRVAIVRLKTDGSVTDWGFSVTEIRYQIDTGSTPPPPPPSGNGGWVDVPVTNVSTPHPYRNNMNQRWTVRGPSNAEKVRVHFRDFETEAGYDFVRLFDARGSEIAKYDGAKGGFTSREVSGSSASIQFTSDYSEIRHGFTVPKIEAWVPSGSTGGCRSDSECGSGRYCDAGTCRTRPTVTRGDEADACDARTAPCRSGLVCAAEQNSDLGGVCASSDWSREWLSFPQSTDHPYKNNTNATYSVEAPDWASQFRVVFTDMDLESNYDWATVEARGQTVGRYTGRHGVLQSGTISGTNRATVRFTSDSSVNAYGFDLDTVDLYGVPDTLAAISLDPRRCSGRLPTDDAGLRTHLESLGVAVYGMRRYRYASNTCTACSCASGERIVILVHARDAHIVKALDRYTGVFSVQQGAVIFDGTLSAMQIAPKQCGSNPWDRYCDGQGRGRCGSTLHSRVSAWAATMGVDILALHTAAARNAVCAGCSCPTTWDLLVAVPSNHVRTMTGQGFSVAR